MARQLSVHVSFSKLFCLTLVDDQPELTIWTTNVIISIMLNTAAHCSDMCVTRHVHGNGIPNGNGNPMGMGTKHGIGDGNGKPPQREWELLALPWKFIPTDFFAAFDLISYSYCHLQLPLARCQCLKVPCAWIWSMKLNPIENVLIQW